MRTRISSILLSAFGLSLLAPAAFAGTPAENILADILKGQGVTEKASVDCSRVPLLDVMRYGEALFAASLDTGSKEYSALLATLSVEKLATLYQNAGLQDLGCPVPTDAPLETPPAKEGTLALGKVTQASVPFRGEGIGFIATWTTIVWMFSALGFAVFMVWITSSKFRFQFRKMAEGEFDMNDKAMTILKERFARGEVTKEQFDKMRRDILN